MIAITPTIPTVDIERIKYTKSGSISLARATSISRGRAVGGGMMMVWRKDVGFGGGGSIGEVSCPGLRRENKEEKRTEELKV